MGMTTRGSARWGLVFAAFSAFVAAGCGITVLVPGETDGAGAQGVGGLGGETTIATTTTTAGMPPPPDGCTADCSQPSNGVDSCNCSYFCASFPGKAKAECEPNVDLQGNLKIKCVCTANDEFTGICFEKNPAHLCDFWQGCCGKYLGK